MAQRSIDVETALNTGRSLANASAALRNAIEEAIAPIKAQLQNLSFREAEALTLSLMHKLNVTSQ